MSKRKRNRSSSITERGVRANEKAAEHAAEQAKAALEQAAIAKRTLRWTLLATFIVAIVGVGGAVFGPLFATRYAETEQRRETYQAQIDHEIATARSFKELISDIPHDMGPSSHHDLSYVRSAARETHEYMVEVDQADRLQELKDGQGVELNDVYIERRELLRRVDRLLTGTVAQAEYRSEHPTEHRDTVNYIFGALNADMQFNIYVHAIKDAADAHNIAFPNDLWIQGPNFTGPMTEDGN
jgi:hypothetical protein